MKQTKKPNIAMRAACVLLCLVLISAHFVTGLYARFVTGAQGRDSGRAAAFRVSASLNGKTENSCGVTLTNGSESAVRYSLTVEAGDPGMFSEIRIGNRSAVPDSEGRFRFPDLGQLPPGGSGALSLSFTVNPAYVDPDAVSMLLDFSNDSSSSAETELPFTVTVSYEQIN